MRTGAQSGAGPHQAGAGTGADPIVTTTLDPSLPDAAGFPAPPGVPLYSSLPSSTGLGMTHRILVVDDEPDITALVAYHLAKVGYRVSTAANGPEALKAAREERPDVVVLDLMLPGVSGHDVLAELRRRDETKDVGVILLTARREEADRIRGLASGADDYLTKPFSPEELVLRVGAVLRRLQSPATGGGGSLLKAGPVAIDRAAHTVSVDGMPVDLTRIEYRLLLLLAEPRGRVQTRPQLLQSVWEAQSDIQ